ATTVGVIGTQPRSCSPTATGCAPARGERGGHPQNNWVPSRPIQTTWRQATRRATPPTIRRGSTTEQFGVFESSAQRDFRLHCDASSADLGGQIFEGVTSRGRR